jgi:orotidine-5'-phosphate decarboxylase
MSYSDHPSPRTDTSALSRRPALAIALDVPDLDGALRLARAVRPWFDIAKVGLQLFTEVGPSAVVALLEEGFEIFLDLKLHDIPNTVERAAAAAGRLRVSLLTAHAAGGEKMLAAAVAGFSEGRTAAGVTSPEVVSGSPAGTDGQRGMPARSGILAVTVLTSEPDPPAGIVGERCRLAAGTGCAGVVCAAAEISTARAVSPDWVVLVPGIRAAGQGTDDQARAATAADAARAGASVLVIGRSVTKSSDPASAAAALAAEVAGAVTSAVTTTDSVTSW